MNKKFKVYNPLKDQTFPKVEFTPNYETCEPVEIEEMASIQFDKVVTDISNLNLTETDRAIMLEDVTQEDMDRVVAEYREKFPDTA
jgi:hypothetical protein